LRKFSLSVGIGCMPSIIGMSKKVIWSSWSIPLTESECDVGWWFNTSSSTRASILFSSKQSLWFPSPGKTTISSNDIRFERLRIRSERLMEPGSGLFSNVQRRSSSARTPAPGRQ
jgi:hypothetical protein